MPAAQRRSAPRKDAAARHAGLKRCVRTARFAAGLRDLPGAARDPRSHLHWGQLLGIHAVNWASLDSLLYHGAFADWVNRRKASTWKKSQRLSASWKMRQHHSNPAHF